MFTRIALAVPFGAAVTMGLLFSMHMMIDSGRGLSHTAAAARIVDFIRVERSEVAETRAARPDRPETPEPAPAMPQPGNAEGFDSEIKLALAGPEIGFGQAEIGGIGFGASDGEYIPLVKVAPVYPMRAAQRRLEGYVIVEFVVTASGGVRDVVVVESTSELFEQAAVDAALKFKYKPRVVDGQAIEVSGVQNKITFKLSA